MADCSDRPAQARATAHGCRHCEAFLLANIPGAWPKYVGHNYINHNHVGHNYKGHNYIGHKYKMFCTREYSRHLAKHVAHRHPQTCGYGSLSKGRWHRHDSHRPSCVCGHAYYNKRGRKVLAPSLTSGNFCSWEFVFQNERPDDLIWVVRYEKFPTGTKIPEL